MALYSLATTPISRATGRSAVASAAYRAGVALDDERQRVVWDFRQKRGVLHTEILLPQGAPDYASDRQRLWNEAEAREDRSTRRGEARSAREFRLALPCELSETDRLEMARDYGQLFVERYGVAVDLAIHAPDRRGDSRNYHAHIMITTRPLSADGFGAKVRALDRKSELVMLREEWAKVGADRLAKAGFPLEAERFRESHRTLAEQAKAAMARGDYAYAAELDREATIHLGPSATKMERDGEASDRGDINRDIAARNEERKRLREESAEVSAKITDLDAARKKRADESAIRSEAKTLDPDRILAALTERRPTFSRADLNRALREFLPDAKARSAYLDEMLGRTDIVPLRETEQAPVSRYTTRAVIDDETRIAEAALRMADRMKHGIKVESLTDTLDAHPQLSDEQRAALQWTTGAGAFAILSGEAGTGKSAVLAAIRDAYETGGYDVRGLAHTNSVVQDLQGDGFSKSATIAAELLRQNNTGRDPWTRQTVLIVDEAAMVSARQLSAILTRADATGAKVILAGDDKQLSSIERGGMFAALRGQHGAAELHEVFRVRNMDQRAAFNAMHRGDFKSALTTFDKQGALHWSPTPEASRDALAAQYAKDSATSPEKTRFVFAYTNAEVHELNAAIRAMRKERGELGEDRSLPTREGERAFATGDRIQFTATAANRAQKAAGLFNGGAGVITSIDENRVSVRLDSPKGAPPRDISFNVGPNTEAGEFDAIRHGYAGTIYKGQGKTLDETYLFHSDNWRASSGYVALSRHRESVKLFAAEKAEAWIMAEGGAAALTEKQRAGAERSYAAWAEAKPEFARKYGFENYVGYLQAHWAEQKNLNRIDRMARQMSRIEETRAASQFVRGAPQPANDDRKPLSLVAGIVADYLEFCYNPAKDWIRWVAEDLRRNAAARLGPEPATEKQHAAELSHESTALADAAGIRREPLPPLQSGLDADGRGRQGADRLPSGPRTDPRRYDELRSFRGTNDGNVNPDEGASRQTSDDDEDRGKGTGGGGKGRSRQGAGGVPLSRRAAPNRYDGLRALTPDTSVRAEPSNKPVPKASVADTDDPHEALRRQLEQPTEDMAKNGGPQPERASEFFKERGRSRGKPRDL
ncbi:MAG: MobQ family relaxase [Methylocystis sp.]